MSNRGTKFNTGKPQIATIPREALIQEANAFMDGRAKYGQWNFKKGMPWHELLDAAMRHITAFTNGEDFVPEKDKHESMKNIPIHHLGCARANLGMLLDYYYNNLGTDDRFKGGEDDLSRGTESKD